MKTAVLARGADPGLLSRRAWRRLEQAGALYVDPTVAREIAERLPPGPERLPSAADALAWPGPAVLVLNREPVPGGSGVEIVPDPHPAMALAASLGLLEGVHPVTLVGGPPANWDALADSGGPLLIGPGYRGRDLPGGLQETGLPPETPVLRVTRPTSPEQRTLPLRVADLEAPGADEVLVVGRTGRAVPFSETRPLAGRRVVVTRAADQAAELTERLEDLGARVLLAPTIRISEPEDPEPLRRALGRLESYDWLIFTSPNAPPRFMAALKAAGRDARALAGLRIACIGPSTAREVENCHLGCDLLPDEYVAEGLLRALEAHPMEGRRVLLARAAEARDVLPVTLGERGAEVDVAPVYRTLPVAALPAAMEAELVRGVDLVTVTASSVVRGFHRLTAGFLAPAGTPMLAIGPITARTARDLGYDDVRQAQEYTLEGLVEAALAALSSGSGSPPGASPGSSGR